MNRNQLNLALRLSTLGFTAEEILTLRRIERTLHKWAELKCGTDAGHIERDEITGKPRFCDARARYVDPQDPRAWRAVPDREKSALAKLAKLMASRRKLWSCHQTDPRGCALYVGRKADIPDGRTIESYYTNGVAVAF